MSPSSGVVRVSITAPSRYGDTDRATEFSFCPQPVINIVTVFAGTCNVEVVGATGDVAVGHGRWQSIWHNGRHGHDFRGSSSIWFVHDDFYLLQGRRSDRTDFAGKSLRRTVLRQK